MGTDPSGMYDTPGTVVAGGTVLVEVSHGAGVAADVTVGWMRWTEAKTERYTQHQLPQKAEER